MRKLFLSFTSTLGLIARGEVSRGELMSGLFYFGCTRQHAFMPWADAEGNPHVHGEGNELLWCFKKPDGSYDADHAAVGHDLLVTALAHAEADNRVEWRERRESQTYEKLDELLVRNGHKPISHRIRPFLRTEYMSPSVVAGIARNGADFQCPGRIG